MYDVTRGPKGVLYNLFNPFKLLYLQPATVQFDWWSAESTGAKGLVPYR